MNTTRSGFALPTVLIACVVMMMVLMASLTASTATKTNLDEQYYLQLAQEAAESGAVFAQDCMIKNNYLATWSGTLDTGDLCNGTTSPLVETYMISTSTMRTRWSVANVPAATDQQFIDVTGYVELKRSSNGAVWKTHTKRLKARVSSEVGISKVAFGYGDNGSGTAYGVYFGTITSTGEIKSVGLNFDGQLGNGTTTNANIPQTYQLPADVAVRDIYASFLSTGRMMYAITTDGLLYVTGHNSSGQLGLGTTSAVTTPQLVTSIPSTEEIVSVDNNFHATYVITRSGKLYAAGNCANGVLGTSTSCTTQTTFTRVFLPLDAGDAKQITTDGYTTFLRTSSGRVYGWGLNVDGAITGVTIGGSTNSPRRIGSFGSSTANAANKIATDGLTLYVVTDDGNLWGIGENEHRQIVDTTTVNYTSPQQMNVNIGSTINCNGSVKDVRTDRSHIAVLFSDGHVCTGGYNGTNTTYYGWLGRNITASHAPLARVTGVTTFGLPSSAWRASAIAVNSIYTGLSQRYNNTFLVGTDGTVFGTGANPSGQLGNNTTTSSRVFVPMQVFGGNEPAKEVLSGYGTTVIYTYSGRVYAVGNNGNGQLGDGTTTNSSIPRANRYLNLGQPLYF